MKTAARPLGSAILAILLLATCLFGVMAATYLQVQNLSTASHQNAAWVEALYAAHAGLQVASAKIGTMSAPLDFSLSGDLQRPGEGPGRVSYETSLSVSPSGGLNMLRLRSTGRAPLPLQGRLLEASFTGKNGSVDRLRPFFLKYKDGATVHEAFTQRSVEAVLSLGLSKYKYALKTKESLRLYGINSIIDSYDSSDPTKSSMINGYPGQYDVTKRQQNGLVATLAGSAGAITLWGQIYGSVATNGVPLVSRLLSLPALLLGNVVRLSGTITTDHTEPMDAAPVPTWAPEASPTGDALQAADQTLLAGPVGSPKRYKFTEANRKMNFSLPPGLTQGEVEVWITGNINANSANSIVVPAGVKATIYFHNGLSINGNAINNQSRNPANLSFIGIRQSGSSAINFNGDGNLWATIYAPFHDLSLSGGQQLYGSFLVKSATLNNTVGIHFDEALRNVGGGLSNSLQLISYIEDLP